MNSSQDLLCKNKAYYPKDENLSILFEKQAIYFPDKIAVKFDGKSLTYEELNNQANKVAHFLLAKGAQPNEYIGISTEKSLDMIIGLLAILKAGGAYVPIDYNYPQKFQHLIINETNLRFVICNDSRQYNFETVQIINITESKLFSYSERNPTHVSSSALSAAYVNFSSGSTGIPKGIICTHRGIIRLLFAQNYIDLSSQSIILNAATLAFDAATFELWGALLHGGTCILQATPVLTSEVLQYLIQEENLNTLLLTTALFNNLVDIDVSCFQGLKQVLVGGEAISFNHIKKLYLNNDEILAINAYGPTENTTITCYYSIPRKEIKGAVINIPIGKPIKHTEVYLINSEGIITSPGVIGEICISGDGLAKGYLSQNDLTQEKFIVNPSTSEPMYKSGDLAQYRADGQIEFIGRKDNEVKINGYRINLEFVESQINNFEIVKSCALIVQNLASGLKILVAFIVLFKKEESKLRKYLKDNLPDYMIPKKIVLKEFLPINKNGKVNRQLLNEELITHIVAKPINNWTNNNVISQLKVIWCNLFSLKIVKLNDNFFHLGGNSLVLMHLDKLIKATFNTNIRIDEFYKNPTLKGLSLIIQNKITIDKQSNDSSPISIHLDVELASNQLRFYEQYKIEPFHTNMNIVFSMKIVAKNLPKFVSDLKDFLSKLRLFKCRLIGSKEQLKMRFNPHDNLRVEYLANEVNCKEELLTQEKIERNYYFNLYEESPLRLKIDIHAEKIYLIFNIHHLFFDGASVECLKNSIRQLASSKKITLPTYDFLDFCKQESLKRKNVSDSNLIIKFKEIYCNSEAFFISTATSKNISNNACGYQLKIDKNQKKILGVTQFLLTFQKLIYLLYSHKQFTCQIPISRNVVGEYAGVLGYFVEVIIYSNTLKQDDFTTTISDVEKAFREAQSFIGLDFLTLVNPEDRFDFSSILFN